MITHLLLVIDNASNAIVLIANQTCPIISISNDWLNCDISKLQAGLNMPVCINLLFLLVTSV